MKHIKFLAVAMTIALSATVMTGCSDKKAEPKLEGTQMGEIKVAETTDAEGSKTLVFINADGSTRETEYTLVRDKKDFLVATCKDGTTELLNLTGGTFSRCDSFKIIPIYPVGTTDKQEQFIKTYIKNGNHLAIGYKVHKPLCAVEGIKEDVIPLTNDYVLFKKLGLWGFAKQGEETPVIGNISKQICVVATPKQVYYWIASEDFTGLVDSAGEGIKPMNANQLKALKKGAKTLWEEGTASAIEVKNI